LLALQALLSKNKGAGMALDFEHIIKRTLAVLAANILPFGLAALLLVGLPSYLLKGELLDIAVLREGFDAGWNLTGLILMAAQITLTAFVIYGTEQHLRGAAAQFEPALRRGVQVILSVWLTALLLWVIFSIGKLLLIIPYFIARMILFVTIPVAVLEEAGPGQALSRSAALTSGHRWSLLGYVIVLWVLGILAGWIVHILLEIAGLEEIAGVVTAALIAAFDAVAVTVIYHDLRQSKDGVDAASVAKIFN
jgi:hypothetical protein